MVELLDALSKYAGLLVFPILAYVLIKKRRKSKAEYDAFVQKIKPAGVYYIAMTLLVMVPLCLLVVVLAFQGTISITDMMLALGLFIIPISIPILLYKFFYKKHKKEKILK